ncbi:hypothetical protein [Pyxidicoccus caerfyrddinensis]|uniref:hypothetical protein n=1 Tax=Pyxidicoccus caerfyrddinensis TaxID=2709663 RepID=UPI0013DD032A|nr:hypothetical protein [Pyxidicoccus caerfyrddinensis]
MTIHHQLSEMIDVVLPNVQNFHSRGQMAPHAASMNGAGQIKGSLLATDNGCHLTVPEALAHFESELRRAAEEGSIVASAIIFHGVGLADPAQPAQTKGEASAIVALLEHEAGDSVFLVIPYQVTRRGIQYEMGKLVRKPAAVFLGAHSQARPWWRSG